MTPERFQSRDVKRRLTKIEKDLVYRDAALVRLKGAIRQLELELVAIDMAVRPLLKAYQWPQQKDDE